MILLFTISAALFRLLFILLTHAIGSAVDNRLVACMYSRFVQILISYSDPPLSINWLEKFSITKNTTYRLVFTHYLICITIPNWKWIMENGKLFYYKIKFNTTATAERINATNVNSFTILISECPQSSKWWWIGDILKILLPVNL